MELDIIEKLDGLVHKNRLVARKLQGTMIDRAYHYFLQIFEG